MEPTKYVFVVEVCLHVSSTQCFFIKKVINYLNITFFVSINKLLRITGLNVVADFDTLFTLPPAQEIGFDESIRKNGDHHVQRVHHPKHGWC